MMNLSLPENVRQLGNNETFQFACHSGVPCFTECCRELELSLTPYDVLRLKNSLNMSAAEFLDRYVIVEKEEYEAFPRFYLTMVDDGRASCPFVDGDGCRVYEARPGACRTYPLGRAAVKACKGRAQEFHVLLTEPHCQGFKSTRSYSAGEWTRDQQLTLYNEINDEVMEILQHRQIKQGRKLSEEEIATFLIALYDLDAFRKTVLFPDFDYRIPVTPAQQQDLVADDLALLRFGIAWLKDELFGAEK